MEPLLQSLDVFVLNSTNEGMSNTILEAMACGVPVVATSVGANGELVVDGQTGYLVPPLNDRELLRAKADGGGTGVVAPFRPRGKASDRKPVRDKPHGAGVRRTLREAGGKSVGRGRPAHNVERGAAPHLSMNKEGTIGCAELRA